VYSGIRLEDVGMNRRCSDSASAMTTPLFQTQPMEPEVWKRDVPSSSHETGSHAAGKQSASTE